MNRKIESPVPWLSSSARITIVAIILLSSAVCAAIAQDTRMALVIGNSDYRHTTALANPLNDARDLARELELLDFEVMLVTDATNAQMARAVRDFSDDARRRRAETALFFYAGHGVQHEGVNFLLPVDADIQYDYELLDAALSMDRVSAALDNAGTRFNLIILDACRDNPFARSRSAASRGLTVMGGAGRGNMVVFATSPGDVADDGTGRNSPFTEAFLEHLTTPDLEVRALITEVQRGVQNRTGGRQIPWVNTSYTGEFFFATAEQQLARTREQERALQAELAAMEAEIAERAARIEQAQSAAERSRLEAEQQRARAEESARRLEAQQLAEIEAQARRAVEQRQADEALRAQMERQLSAQRASLTRQAEERRAELEALQQRSTVGDSIFNQFEAVAELNRAIADIRSRFDATITRMERDVNNLYDTRVGAVRENNPREPWDTAAEYEELIADLTREIEAEREADLRTRRRELTATREAELEDLRRRLAERRQAITGREFTLGAGTTEVQVARFNAEAKHFPIRVRTTDERHDFSVPLFFTIESENRDVIREEYYRVFSADQSGGLAGEITYTVFAFEEDLWVLQPVRTRVVNLLEGDAELVGTTTGAGQMLVSTADTVKPVAGVVRFESEQAAPAEVRIDGRMVGTTGLSYRIENPDQLGTRRIEYRWRDGRRRTFAVNFERGINAGVRMTRQDQDPTRETMILVTGVMPETRVQPGARAIRAVTTGPDESQAIVSVSDGTHLLNISGRWLSDDYQETLRINHARGDAAVVHFNLADHGIHPVGELAAAIPRDVDASYVVFDDEGNPVVERQSTGDARLTIPLAPGSYQLAARRTEDPYTAVIEPFTVAAQRPTEITLQDVPLSVRYELDTAHARHAQVEQRISGRRTRSIIGWSLIGAGALSLGGAGYSYVQGQDAISTYDRATSSRGAADSRGDIEQWGLYFSIGAIVGGVSTLTGAGVLGLGPRRSALIEERNELDRRINRLSAEFARQAAQNALYGRGWQ